ncbi:MAG: hypothetical protein H6739_31795 [Alphaproteobacteria bacterium]|nr:hypothetical protein [Alphaproteobacteria bacterium]
MTPQVAVTGVGLVCALGDDPAAVAARLAAGDTAVGPLGLPGLPDAVGARVPGPSPKELRRWLVRRKDAKLLPRAAELVLPAAGRALGDWPGDREQLGLFFGVRREPPDTGEADAAMVAACVDGRLSPALLAGPGRDLYPPLLPLKTLPNMVLAHVSINLGVMGTGDTCAGGPAAGLTALRAALWAVVEGRCPAALVGAADSHVDGGSVRDRARLRQPGPAGEAAIVLRIEPLGAPGALFHLADLGAGLDAPGDPTRWAHHAGLGDCGVADGLLALALGGPGPVVARDDDGTRAGIARTP